MPVDAMEDVVLVDRRGKPIGTAVKSKVHSTETPLHLAFSCYLFNEKGEVLVTRRALSKITWAGVWTNSFCGHPAPGEEMEDAIRRRAKYELGVSVESITLQISDFSYRAVDASGIVENEICPVFSATICGDLKPHPDEVIEWAWTAVDDLARSVEAAPFAFSPWMKMQLELLGSRDRG